MRPLPFRAIIVMLGAAALLSGCGNPDYVTDRDGVLRLELGDPEYSITPGRIRVSSGKIKIIARNAGTLTHNVRVEEVNEEEGATAKVFASTQTMQPGESAPSIEIRLFPGEYRLVCSIGNHENLGQYAELEVTDAGEAQ
ncbi:MAG: hypothetical protein H0V81_05455 [Solirubrobacterales bacterium]|nr:hypothetical protein [Solirubrobacterales bacterium]